MLDFESAFFLGCLGGFIAEGVNIFGENRRGRRSSGVPRDVFTWARFIFWIFAGGVVAWVHDPGDAPLPKLVAFQLGLTGPLVLERLARALPAGDPGTTDVEDQPPA